MAREAADISSTSASIEETSIGTSLRNEDEEEEEEDEESCVEEA